MSFAYENCVPADFVSEAQTCRDAIEPALRQVLVSAQERGWTSQQVHLAMMEIAIASIKTDGLDITTLAKMRRAAWRGDFVPGTDRQ